MSEEGEEQSPPEPTVEELLAELTPTQLQYLEALPEHNWKPWKTGQALGLGDGTVSRWNDEPRFVAARAALLKRSLAAAGATYERTLMEISRIAFGDVREVLGSSNKARDAAEWDDDTAAAVAGIDTETRWEGKGDDAEEVIVTKIRMHPKMDALKTLLAIHGKLIERHEHTGKDGAPLGVPIFQIVRYDDDDEPAKDTAH